MLTKSNTPTFDIAIIGPGPIGLITALAIAIETANIELRPSIAIFGPKPSAKQLAKDTRTTAFMQPSLTMLENLGITPKASKNAAPLKHLQMIDDCGGLLRAPDCHFSALELGLDYFAQNIPNSDLNQTLIELVSSEAAITWIETSGVTAIIANETDVIIETAEDKTYSAHLCIGADGRNSICRTAANIKTTKWSYEQTAIACSFTHKKPHQATSIELHRPSGPLTLIPLQENHASLVWSLKPKDAENIKSLSTEQFCAKLFEASHGLYGEITDAGPRAAFPISGMKLDKFANNRIALVGEAAHVVPPIGAQGMNIGMSDTAHLVDAIKSNIESTKDGSAFKGDISNLLQTYNKARQFDVSSRTYAIDLLNKSLLVSFLPLKIARTIGLNLLNNIPPLRNLLMKQGLGAGLGDGANNPTLMRQNKQAA